MTDAGQESQSGVIEIVEGIIGPERLQVAKETFKNIDNNNDGKLELSEVLAHLLERERVRITKKFEYHDEDGDGYINFEEFLFAVVPSIQIVKSFQEFDADGDGKLGFAEVGDLVDKLELPLEGQQLERLLAQADSDGDGKLTFYELYGAISHHGLQ